MTDQEREQVEADMGAARRSADPWRNLRKLIKKYDHEHLNVAMECATIDQLPVVQQAIDKLRYEHTTKRLEAIEKPNWFDTWTFRFVIIGTIIAFLDYSRPFLPADSSKSSTPRAPQSIYPSSTEPAPALDQEKSSQSPLLPPTNSAVAPASPKK